MHTEETGQNLNKRYVLSGFLQEQRIDMGNVHDIVDEGRCQDAVGLDGEAIEFD